MKDETIIILKHVRSVLEVLYTRVLEYSSIAKNKTNKKYYYILYSITSLFHCFFIFRQRPGAVAILDLKSGKKLPTSDDTKLKASATDVIIKVIY